MMTIRMPGRTYTIRELSNTFGVTPRTIRFYESRSLLSPQRKGNVRLYSSRDKSRLSAILKGKRVGFSLAEIGEILAVLELSGKGTTPNLQRALDLFDARITDLERQRADLESSLHELHEGRAKIEVALVEHGHRITPRYNVPKLIGYGLQPIED